MAVNYSHVTQVNYGDKGSGVRTLQELLNSNGYSVDVDGKFGPQTQAAVKDYQQKNNLTVDGIVGNQTWGALTKSNGQQTGAATTAANTPTYTKPEYKPSDAVSQAEALLNQQMQQKPGDYQSTWQGQLNETINKILNREEFSFDLNKDALYQQYADQYTRQGKLAMMDTMGQAAAMTGGYGNSFAQTAGQQTYQGYLQQLNEVVPELYQMQLNQYNQEGQDLYNQYSMLGTQEEQDYGRYRDQVSDYYNQLQQLYDQYNTERNFDYTQYADERDFGYEQYQDDLNYHYQTGRDQVADEQWQKEYDLALQKYKNSKSSSSSSSSSSSNDSSYSGIYDNGSLTESQVKALQKAIGATVDGKFGSQSKEKAGGLSAEEAYKKYVGGSLEEPQQTETQDVSNSIKNKASSFTTNEDLANYLDGLTSSGSITEAQADALYAEYKQVDKVALNKRSWTLEDDGGVNWFWGVDNNATVKDQYGNTYRLDKLVDALVAEGMTKDEAKAYVKKLQAQLGA